MTRATPYRIELRGRLSDDILGPYAFDFVISRTAGKTTLVGPVRDAAHLHGIILHLTSQGIDVVTVNVNAPPSGPEEPGSARPRSDDDGPPSSGAVDREA